MASTNSTWDTTPSASVSNHSNCFSASRRASAGSGSAPSMKMATSSSWSNDPEPSTSRWRNTAASLLSRSGRSSMSGTEASVSKMPS